MVREAVVRCEAYRAGRTQQCFMPPKLKGVVCDYAECCLVCLLHCCRSTLCC